MYVYEQFCNIIYVKLFTLGCETKMCVHDFCVMARLKIQNMQAFYKIYMLIFKNFEILGIM